jgi:hypothetical protein
MPSSPDTQPAHAAPTPRTRASSQQTGNKSRPDLLADPHASVRTKEQARLFLSKHGFLAKDSPATTDQLSYVLLSLAHSSSGKTLEEGIRAVAILLTVHIVSFPLVCNTSAHSESRYVPHGLILIRS